MLIKRSPERSEFSCKAPDRALPPARRGRAPLPWGHRCRCPGGHAIGTRQAI